MSRGISERDARMIDCVCDIAAREPEGEHFTSHYLFIAKVLREPRTDALPMAAAFRHVRLTRETCAKVAAGWSA
jgi:hypothetical protein